MNHLNSSVTPENREAAARYSAELERRLDPLKSASPIRRDPPHEGNSARRLLIAVLGLLYFLARCCQLRFQLFVLCLKSRLLRLQVFYLSLQVCYLRLQVRYLRFQIRNLFVTKLKLLTDLRDTLPPDRRGLKLVKEFGEPIGEGHTRKSLRETLSTGEIQVNDGGAR